MGIGTAAPEARIDAAAMQARGADLRLLREVGFTSKQEPVEDVSPWHLALEAARRALEDAGLSAQAVDAVVCVSRLRYDYFTWSLALAVQRGLGADGAAALDISEATGGSLLAGVRIGRARLLADPRVRTVLVIAVQRASDMVDTRRADDRWLWPLGDGAAAVVLQRAPQGIEPLAHSFVNEGRGSLRLGVRVEVIDEGPTPGSFYDHEWAQAKWLTLHDGPAWYADFRGRAARRVPQVVREAVVRAGIHWEDIAVVHAGFLYPEVREIASRALGVQVHARTEWGIAGGVEHGLTLRDLSGTPRMGGSVVVLCHAGLPAQFGALVLRL